MSDVYMMCAVLSRREVGERCSEVKNKGHKKSEKIRICLNSFIHSGNENRKGATW
jgi:hypothetical protein